MGRTLPLCPVGLARVICSLRHLNVDPEALGDAGMCPIGSFFFRCLSKREFSSGRLLCFGGGSTLPTPLPSLPRATPHPAAFCHQYTRDGMVCNPNPPRTSNIEVEKGRRREVRSPVA